MIKLIKWYKRPNEGNKYIDNYYTQRYRKDMTLQGKITLIETVYSDNDPRQHNPIIRIEMVDIRNAEDGEYIRSFLVDFPVKAQRHEFTDGTIQVGDVIQFNSTVTVLEKTESAKANGPKFVKYHCPDLIAMSQGDSKSIKVEPENVKPIVKGVLYKDDQKYVKG